MTSPRISVVMPTHNRGKLLPATLRSLATQTVPPSAYEVILVADGCTDETPAAVASVRAELPYRLHFIEQPAQGAAAARNRGVERATAPLILFLDDDMDAAPTLIEAHLSAHAAEPGSLVLGYFPIPFGPVKDDPFAGPARDWWDEGFAERRKPGYRFGFRDFCTGNISLSIEAFRAAGGFYQRIKSAGEDWELGYRLLKSGARFRFAERALSLHQDFTSFERALQRTRLEGLATRPQRATAHRARVVFQAPPAKPIASVPVHPDLAAGVEASRCRGLRCKYPEGSGSRLTAARAQVPHVPGCTVALPVMRIGEAYTLAWDLSPHGSG